MTDIIYATEEWLKQQTLIETAGFITGVACVLLAALNNIWNWPIAIISVTLYIFIFYDQRLYADMGLQVYFLVMNVYGWYFWSRKKPSEAKAPVLLISKKEVVCSVLAIALITPALGYTLIKLAPILHYQPASFPYLDSFCTACSIVAQVFLARKVLENWLIWVFVDVIYVGVYIFKGLDLTAILYAILIGIAIMGYRDWKRDYRKQRYLFSEKS